MPCLCRLYDKDYDKYQKQLSFLIHDIAFILREAHQEADCDLLKQVHKGIDHAFYGECPEKTKSMD